VVQRLVTALHASVWSGITTARTLALHHFRHASVEVSQGASILERTRHRSRVNAYQRDRFHLQPRAKPGAATRTTLR
jgi:hypothetical protein